MLPWWLSTPSRLFSLSLSFNPAHSLLPQPPEKPSPRIRPLNPPPPPPPPPSSLLLPPLLVFMLEFRAPCRTNSALPLLLVLSLSKRVLYKCYLCLSSNKHARPSFRRFPWPVCLSGLIIIIAIMFMLGYIHAKSTADLRPSAPLPPAQHHVGNACLRSILLQPTRRMTCLYLWVLKGFLQKF